MLSGFYTISSGMLTRQREIDVISNNLVNVNTPGYTAERVVTGSFEQELAVRLQNQTVNQIGGSMQTSNIITGTIETQNSGLIKETGKDFDIALNGVGLFQVEQEDGVMAYTRNGQFDMNEEGYLILEGVGYVQGNGGAIKIDTQNFSIDYDGSVYDQDGQYIDKISAYILEEGGQMEKQPSGVFTSDDMQAVIQGTSFHQGSLELSNVDMNTELTHLVDIQRSFQTCSSAIQIIDTLNQKAATKLGALQ